MLIYKKENQLPIKSWIPEEQYYADKKMVEQVENLARLPFAFSHIVLCPDGHVGYGMPIGGVLATKNVVIPNAVGLDIGCGLVALKTSLTNIDIETLKIIFSEIRQIVPVGFEHQKLKQDESLMPRLSIESLIVVKNQYQSALQQLGTLGGGNHFIEIQKGNDNHIWIMLHSGSRNLGKQVADYYNKVAIFQNNLWFSKVDSNQELAFLPIETKEAKEYMNEMDYCIEFAFANRLLMIENIKKCFNKILNNKIEYDSTINIAHNYARFEHHFNTNVIIHRKGATSAKLGEIGIIPGSQGSKSFIVEGLGNPESFMSCSHGAGRKMGRKEAQKTLNLEDEQRKLDEQGILHAIRGKNDLDEASGAYKDISSVMENQKDLVKILVELSPLGVIKG